MLVDENHNVRDYEQIKGSRTQAAITAWVKVGHKTVSPKVSAFGFVSPMSAWWRALYGGLGRTIDLHEKGQVPVHLMAIAVVTALLFIGCLLIGCLMACTTTGGSGTSSGTGSGSGSSDDGAASTAAASGSQAAAAPPAPTAAAAAAASGGGGGGGHEELLKYAVD
jgi:hypothetical protein